jgi:hypothetical protein
MSDPMLWLNTALVEDVMMSMLVMATGMQLYGYSGTDEVFGILHKGLADEPEEMMRRGYGIIHSVRNDPRHSESEIRQYFQSRRQCLDRCEAVH